jgi:hypothetical protein
MGGLYGQGFVRAGEDGTDNYEALDVLIENNLMIGNNTQQIRAPFQMMGVYSVTVRANTVTGDMPAKEYGARIFTYGPNPDNDQIHLHNNIWSDPTGTTGDTFSRGGATSNLTFDNNLFWNNGNPFPTSSESIVEVNDDAHGVVGDPLLADQTGLVLPRWEPDRGQFADGSSTIRQAFERLVMLYAAPAEDSAAIDGADPNHAPIEDILGNSRALGPRPDIGAYEFRPALTLHAIPGDRQLHLHWSTSFTPSVTNTRRIDYESQTGTVYAPTIDLPNTVHHYTLSDLTNYVWYTVTLSAMLGDTAYLSDTTRVMPTDQLVFVPVVSQE